MTILMVSDFGSDPSAWQDELGRRVEGLQLVGWGESCDFREVEALIVDTSLESRGGFGQFPSLAWVHYLGHGVGDVLLDPSLPPDVPVTRQRHQSMASAIALYVVQAITAHHLGTRQYRQQQRDRIWRRSECKATELVTVGVLGLGLIGRTIADRAKDLGYGVRVWSRTQKQLPDYPAFAGEVGLREMLPGCDFIVGALPATRETIGLINRDTLSLMKPGVYLVNIGRGSLIVDDDLLQSLDAGTVAGAALDVFNREPLPPDHAYWHHPNIVMTPHSSAAARGDRARAFDEVAENYARLKAGKPLWDVADRALGY